MKTSEESGLIVGVAGFWLGAAAYVVSTGPPAVSFSDSSAGTGLAYPS
jgi:hypothetical protein